MDILQAIADPNIFGSFFDDLKTWKAWTRGLLPTVYGLPVRGATARRLVRQCTGRKVRKLPPDGFRTNLILTGRRSGKSRMSAVIGAFETVLGGHEKHLAKGERGLLPIISPTRHQSSIVHNYMRALFEAPLLANEVINETKDGFELSNGIRVAIVTGDWKHVRGFTVISAVVDEIAFFQVSEECKLTDVELIRSIRPALATVPNSKLVCISTKYAARAGPSIPGNETSATTRARRWFGIPTAER